MVEGVEVIDGEKLSAPEDPEKEGFNFDYWMDENEEKYNFDKPVKSDFTLYAKWRAIKPELFNVILEGNGGISEVTGKNIESYQVTFGDEIKWLNHLFKKGGARNKAFCLDATDIDYRANDWNNNCFDVNEVKYNITNNINAVAIYDTKTEERSGINYHLVMVNHINTGEDYVVKTSAMYIKNGDKIESIKPSLSEEELRAYHLKLEGYYRDYRCTTLISKENLRNFEQIWSPVTIYAKYVVDNEEPVLKNSKKTTVKSNKKVRK